MLIVQPRASGFNAYSLLALAAVIFIVARDLTTRRLDPAIPSLGVTLGNSVFVLCRSEEHTSELQSLMRISYAVFCLKKKNIKLTVLAPPILQSLTTQSHHSTR